MNIYAYGLIFALTRAMFACCLYAAACAIPILPILKPPYT